MNTTLSSKSKSLKFSLPMKSLLAVVVMVGFSSNASAQWVVTNPITDILNAITQTTDNSASIARLKQLKDQYDQAREQYEELKTKIDGVQQLGTNMTMGVDLKPRDAEVFGMKQKCPGATGSIVSTFMSAFTLDLKSDLATIKAEQQKICQRIVYAENLQYNESITVINLMRKQTDKLKEMSSRRSAATGETNTAIMENSNDLEAFIATATTNSQYSNSVIQAYETYINTLKQNQAMLTKVAMDGNASDSSFVDAVSRKLVQGAVLEAALDSAGNRDR